MKFNKSKLAKGLGATGVVATPTGLWIDQLLKNQSAEQKITVLKSLEEKTRQQAITIQNKDTQISDMLRDTYNSNSLNQQAFENNQEMINTALKDIDELLEDIEQSDRHRDFLTKENTRLETINKTLEEKIENQTELYINSQNDYLNLNKLFKESQEQVRDLLKDRTQFQKWQAWNPMEMKAKCWISRTQDKEDASAYGLNCPQKWINNAGQERDTLFVVWAKKEEHPALYKDFQETYKKFGDGAWDGKTPPKPPR